MNIRTEYWAKPIPIRTCDWTAIDADTYDGAPDSSTRNMVGYGVTEQEAIDNLLEQIAWCEDRPLLAGANLEIGLARVDFIQNKP